MIVNRSMWKGVVCGFVLALCVVQVFETYESVSAVSHGVVGSEQVELLNTTSAGAEKATSNTSGCNISNTAITVTKLVEKQRSQVDNFCSRLPAGKSASILWNENFDSILNASLAPANRTKDSDYLLSILKLVSTHWLRKGYRTAPSPKSFGKVLDIVHRRLDDPTAPPLKVAIFGGSVTGGRGSDGTPADVSNKEFQKPPGVSNFCWVKRFSFLINTILTGDPNADVVKVINLAIGGTNSQLALPIVKYKLYNSESTLLPSGPDVVINAYSTNDNLVHGHHIDVTVSNDYENKRRNLAQRFMQAVLESRPCEDPPLLIYMDDYLGNQHDRIQGETVVHKVVQELSDWYETMYVSYAEAVRRFVVAKDSETTFSPRWAWNSTQRGVPETEVHVGFTGHMTMAWVLGYATLAATVDYCDDLESVSSTSSWVSNAVLDRMENVVPPNLDAGLLWSTVSGLWRQKETLKKEESKRLCSDPASEDDKPCVFAFTAGPAGTVKRPSQLKSVLKQLVKDSNGWSAQDDMNAGGWSNKLGYVGQGTGARVVFKQYNVPSQIKVLRIYYLKSYGEKWENSTLSVEIGTWGKKFSGVLEKFDLLGYHNSTTSISYMHEVDLGDRYIPKDDGFQMRMEIVNGTNFKITAMTICSR